MQALGQYLAGWVGEGGQGCLLEGHWPRNLGLEGSVKRVPGLPNLSAPSFPPRQRTRAQGGPQKVSARCRGLSWPQALPVWESEEGLRLGLAGRNGAEQRPGSSPPGLPTQEPQTHPQTHPPPTR